MQNFLQQKDIKLTIHLFKVFFGEILMEEKNQFPSPNPNIFYN
jgi:hypothetical protein